MKNIFKKVETVYGCDHVQAEWLNNLPWKMQTVINQGLRAPDTHYCKAIKLVCRWMRGVILNNADKKHTFMCKSEGLPKIEDLQNEINYCSMHFTTHFLYALEIIGRKHPEKCERDIAWNYYQKIVEELFHFNVEKIEQLDNRLADVDREKEPPKCPSRAYDQYIRDPW